MTEQAVFDTVSLMTHGYEGTAPRVWSVTTIQTLDVLMTPGAVSSFVSYNRLKAQDILLVNYNMASVPSQIILTVTPTSGGSLVIYPIIPPIGPLEQYSKFAITSTQFINNLAAGISLVPAQGANTLIVLKQAQLLMTYGGTQYTGGSGVEITYGFGGVASIQLAATAFTGPTVSTGYNLYASASAEQFSDCVNAELSLQCVGSPFAAGNSNFVLHIWYSVIPTV